MKKILFLFALPLFILSACAPASAPENPSTARNESSMTEESPSEGNIYGTWTRTATYADGELLNTVPATLFINEDGSYQSSSADCATSSTQLVTDNSIAVSMTQSSCPGNIALPYNLTYTFEIAEDGQSMVMMTANVKEDYIRAQDAE